jgi:DNA polymerase-3 subunit alpha
MQAAEEKASDRRRGQRSFLDLFEGAADPNGDGPANGAADHGLPDVPEWPETDRLKFEKEALDFYISSHPLAQHDEQLRRFRTHDAAQVVRLPGGTPVLAAGMVTQLQQRVVQKNGKRWAMFQLEDFTGQCKCILWSDEFARFKDLVADDAILLLEGVVEWREGGTAGDLIVKKVLTVDDARREMTKGMLLRLPYADDAGTLRKLDALGLVLRRFRGQTPVFLSVRDANGRQVQLRLNDEFRVNPAALKLDELEMILGPGAVVFTR